MPYDCIVLAKQVPDTKNVTGEAMREDGTVNRAALPAIYNPEDLNALEMALQVRDEHGGRVTVITMGPPAAAELLRESLYCGADEVILLTDRRFAAADTLATSYALSCAVKKVGKCDLVLCGRQAIDGDTAQVGPQTAEKLDMNQVTYVEKIVSLKGDTIEVERGIDSGTETLKARLPLLLTVTDTANEPRPGSAKRILQYRNQTCGPELVGAVSKEFQTDGKEVDPAAVSAEVAARLKEAAAAGRTLTVWDADAIGADASMIGMNGSPTKVKNIESVVLTGEDLEKIEPTEEGCKHLIKELVADHILG